MVEIVKVFILPVINGGSIGRSEVFHCLQATLHRFIGCEPPVYLSHHIPGHEISNIQPSKAKTTTMATPPEQIQHQHDQAVKLVQEGSPYATAKSNSRTNFAPSTK
jgi:hypothetical protein